MKRLLIFLLAGGTLVSSCKKFDFWSHGHGSSGDPAQVAYDWYTLQLRLLFERNSSLNAVNFAYEGIALYESVAPSSWKSRSFSSVLYQMPVMPGAEEGKSYNWVVSANAAMASVLKAYNTGLTAENLASIDSLENAYNDRLRRQCSSAVFARSQGFGKSIASAVYNWSLTDRFNPSNAGFVPPVFFGAWVPTPPAFANGIMPYIGSARPLLMEDSLIAGPGFPFPCDSNPSSDYYKMAMQVYQTSKTLTTEQKNIALFWVDQGNRIGFTPGGHDLSIITQILASSNSNLLEAAEVFAKSGIAEREATIVVFRIKYTKPLIRPVSYIRQYVDPAWSPFIPTPPHPEYPAAHALVTGSVMETAEVAIGKQVAFTDHTNDVTGQPSRKYSSLFAAGEEAGISRLYGGIHYLPSINIGLSIAKEMGTRIGKIKMSR